MTDELANQPKKDIRFNDDARSRIIEGIDILANAVKVTLGPGGRNVIIARDGQPPISTKDGVTVARHVRLRDAHHDAGAQVVLEAASRTNDVAGDGTTTATVLAQAIVHAGRRALAGGHQPKALKHGMELAKDDIITQLKSHARPVETSEQIANVGTISANGDKIVGDALAAAMDKVGSRGIITIEDAKGIDTQLELIDGVRLDRGYTSPYFVNDVEHMQVTFEDAYVLISDRTFKTIPEVLPLLERISKEGKPLLIIADEVKDDALKLMTMNKMRGQLHVCVIVAPGRGSSRIDLLGDLAAVLGGTVISTGDDHVGAELTLDQLGRCSKIVVTRTNTTLIGGAGDKGQDSSKDVRKRGIEEKIHLDPTIDELELGRLRERLGILCGAAAIIKVGGSTEVELGERRDRIVDALNATQAAADEGIITGGGTALYRAAHRASLERDRSIDESTRVGYDIVVSACSAPIRQILENAGFNAEKILAQVDMLEIEQGFDAAAGQFVNMYEHGVIDPVKVSRSALENAVSVGGIIVTLGASIVDDVVD